jgi:hypothetical protein
MEPWWAATTPQEWIDRLGCKVTVQLKGSQAPIEGFLYSVDPELHHLMILRPAPPAATLDKVPPPPNLHHRIRSQD